MRGQCEGSGYLLRGQCVVSGSGYLMSGQCEGSGYSVSGR